MRRTWRQAAVLWMIALLAPLSCGAQSVRDGFDYAGGTGGEPAWAPGSATWMVSDGRLTFSGGTKSFITHEHSPEGHSVTVEAAVQVDAPAGDGWGVAGVAVRHDDGDHWHLALVSAPAGSGGGRYVELAEDYHGLWNAHLQGATALRLTVNESGSFRWELGRPYRLRITLKPDGVEGTVSDADGKLLRRIAYAFDDKPAVKSGRPALDCALLRGWFDDVAMDVADRLPAAAEQAPTFPPYTLPGFDGIHGRATGFFHTERQDGRWWLIDPNGSGFLVAGVDHVNYSAGWCQKLGYSPYHRNVEAIFGSEAGWARNVAARLHAWGFNTLGAGCAGELRYTHFAHTEWFGAGRSFADLDAIVPPTTWTGFPNVFSPRWRRQCDLLARRICTPERDDPWLLGYFLDNELQWFGALGNWRNEAGLFTETWRKPAPDPAKQAWLGVVRDSCPTVAKFNAAWRTEFASFDALAASVTPVDPPTDAARAMVRSYTRLVADAYFRTATEAIRRYDPNHMVLGCRFAGWAPDIWDIAGRYCDVVSFNSYPRIDVDRGVPQSVVDEYRAHYEQAGRPLLITEWSFPAMDSDLPNLHGAGMRVATQDQRAACFRAFQSTLFGLPFFVGSDYFMYVDEPALGIADTFPEDSNYGLVDVNDHPWEALTTAAASVNAPACELHLSGELPHVYAQAAGPVWTLSPPPPPEHRVTAQAVTAHCGPLQVDFDSAKGPALLLQYSGEELGRFVPLLHQKTPADAWTPPDSAAIYSVQPAGDFTAVDITFRHGPGTDRAPAYDAGWRFWFPHRLSGWFATQSLWIENTDNRPWTLAGIFQYARPSIGGSPDGDVGAGVNVPNFYMPIGAWEDAEAGLGLGVLALSDVLKVTYWKDKDGFHSDCRQELNVPLKPGERYTKTGPAAIVFGYHAGGTDALLRAADRVRAEALSVQPRPTAH